jgi:uncharacterized membrane protein YfcA
VDTLTIVLLSVAALGAGTVDAIAGGGGVITLPALLAAGLPPHQALGTNKGQSVWGSCAAMIAFWRAERVDRKQAERTFPLGFAGSVGGAALVSALDKEALRPIVIAMLIGAAVLLVIKKPVRTEDARARWFVAPLLALSIGAYDGFFGPGTGTFLIVGFVVLCGRSLVHASADAKVVNFASNLAAMMTFAYHGYIVWEVALPMAAGQLIGGIVGAQLAMKGGERIVRGVVLAVSGALIVKLVVELI